LRGIPADAGTVRRRGTMGNLTSLIHYNVKRATYRVTIDITEEHNADNNSSNRNIQIYNLTVKYSDRTMEEFKYS
jgi:hypothetical protein